MAKIYGPLEYAQLQPLSADPSSGKRGLIYLNTTDGKVKLDNGSAIRAFLLNDQNIFIGTSGTAASNVRLNRAGAGFLQFLLGSDATAEGSTSAALAQVDLKHPSYTTGGRPAAGNAGRAIWNSTTNTLQVDTGAAWAEVAGTGGLTWAEVTGTSQTMAVDSGYIANNAARISFALPTTAALGKIVEVAGKGAGGWKITQAAGQSIINGRLTTLVGTSGELNSGYYTDSVRLLCIVANTTFMVISGKGDAYTQKKGYVMGGMALPASNTFTTSIEDYVFSADTSAIVSGQTIDVARYSFSGTSSPTKGYGAGGNNASGTDFSSIEDMNYSAETSTLLGVSLTAQIYATAGTQSTTAGYWMGGYHTTQQTTNHKLTFAGESIGTAATALPAAKNGAAGASSSTKGYAIAGYNGASYRAGIDALVFSGESCGTVTTALNVARADAAACQSSTAGYTSGGSNGSELNSAEKFIFANDSVTALASVLATNIVAQRNTPTGLSGPLKGLFCGGVVSTTTTNRIDSVTYSSDTFAQESATLDVARYAAAGVY